MELDFMRTAARSYMIVKDAGFEYEDFELQMILNNRIPGLLNLQVICSGGKFDYYYDITGLQSMEIVLGVQPITSEILTRYMREICDERIVLENYLLDAEDLVFSPNMLFQDKGSEKLCFCCIPGYHTQQENGLKVFMEEILKIADHSDPKTVKVMYDLYEQCASGMAGIEDLLKTVSRQSEEENREAEKNRITTETPDPTMHLLYGSDPDTCSIREDSSKKRREFAVSDRAAEMDRGYYQSSVQQEKNAGDDREEAAWEEDLFPGYNEKNRKTRRKEKKTSAGKNNREKNTKNQSRKRNQTEKKKHRRHSAGQPSADWYAAGFDEVPPDYTDFYEEKKESEKTIYMPQQNYRTILQLVYCGNGHQQTLRLDHFPYTIGKNPQQADGVIHAESVSRIHACIRQSGGEYFLEDMNSTNGTYLNHEILTYRTPVPLKVNDHILFGTEEFVLNKGFYPE